MSVIDISGAEREARDELAAEQTKTAKDKIKAKLREIANAEKILQNLRNDLDVIKRDLGAAPSAAV